MLNAIKEQQKQISNAQKLLRKQQQIIASQQSEITRLGHKVGVLESKSAPALASRTSNLRAGATSGLMCNPLMQEGSMKSKLHKTRK
jgi:septal ring factor EnvC (AmiA/AmiB activator)